MGGAPEPDWYFDNVLVDAVPGGPGPVRGPAGRWQQWWTDQLRGAAGPLAASTEQGFVLTSSQVHALGVTRSQARTAVRRGEWSAPARGVLAPVRTDDGADPYLVARRVHALAAAAAALGRPDHVVAARSAAVLHGLPTLRTPHTPELLAASRYGLGRRTSSHAYGATSTAAEIQAWFGVAVTAVARTLVDLARHDRRDGLLAADAALHERLVTRAAVDVALARAAGWPGVRGARDVLGLADGAAESPLESLTRIALRDAGFPPPRLQFEIGRYRVDFCWPEHRFVLEADGRGKYTGGELWHEKRREQALRAEGYRVERVVWSDVLREWGVTAGRLWSVLRAN